MKSRFAAVCGVAFVLASGPAWVMAEDKPAGKPPEKPQEKAPAKAPEKAADKPADKAPDRPAATQPAGPLKDRAGYVLGIIMAQQLKMRLQMDMPAEAFSEISGDEMLKGMADVFGNQKPKMTDDEFRMTIQEFQKILLEKVEKKNKEIGEKNKTEGAAFLEKNKAAEGVKTTASGLQYKVVKEGTGKQPTEADMVTVNYKGTLIDGTVFDDSSKHGSGEPATLPVALIKGWNEGLRTMKTGGKSIFYLKPDLAYGDQGAPPAIGPNAVLVFEIELIEVTPPKASTPAPAPMPAPAPK